MNDANCYREYLKKELLKCEEKLQTLTFDEQRFNTCLSYIGRLRECLKDGISKEYTQSIYLPVDKIID